MNIDTMFKPYNLEKMEHIFGTDRLVEIIPIKEITE